MAGEPDTNCWFMTDGRLVHIPVEALDNLLTLFGLQRKPFMLCGGFVIFHPSNPRKTRWISASVSEESWLEDVKLLAK
jgi:hypothetical protein